MTNNNIVSILEVFDKVNNIQKVFNKNGVYIMKQEIDNILQNLIS